MSDTGDILRHIAKAAQVRLDRIDAFTEIASTSSWLLEQPTPAPGRFRVATAEHQTAGRGRQGKNWISPPSTGICLSVAYTFAGTDQNLSGLTLAAGVGLADRLRKLGARGMALKWPNDVVLHDRKLGGILTEMQSRDGRQTVVIGVGLNVELPNAMRYGAAAKWKTGIADLAESIDKLPARPELSAAVIECVIEAITRFEHDGFAPFHAAWRSFDWLQGRPVIVELPGGSDLQGLAEGVDSDGALLVRSEGGLQRVISGSVTATGRSVASA